MKQPGRTFKWQGILAVALLVAVYSCSKPESPLRSGFETGNYRTIVAFGDSIVEGHNQPEGWPEMLEKDLVSRFPGVSIMNAGISGDTAGNGLARLERDVLSHDPDLVIVSFGLNDMKNGVPPEGFRRNMSAIIDGGRASGAEVVLLTTTRLQRGTTMVSKFDPTPFNEIIVQLASQENTHLIDVYEDFKGLNTPKYLMDVAHPNMEGYRRLTEIIRMGLIGE